MERLERGDMEGLDGIPLRRTKGEVTAKNKNNIAIISHFFLLTKKKTNKTEMSVCYHWQESGNGRKCLELEAIR